MDDLIFEKEVEAGVPEALRSFFLITCEPLSRKAAPVIGSIWEAIKIFAPKIKLVRPMHIVIGVSPFKVEQENFCFSFSSKGLVINSVLETFIFLDVDKMFCYSKELQIATVLEEFVHGFMNVVDEELTKRIVCSFYSEVILINGCYAKR